MSEVRQAEQACTEIVEVSKPKILMLINKISDICQKNEVLINRIFAYYKIGKDGIGRY